MTTSYNPNLGYILIERQYGDDLVVVYPSKEKAQEALIDDMLIEGFCEVDCLDAWVLEENDSLFIESREVVLTDGVETIDA